jgi:hypothetical protein
LGGGYLSCSIQYLAFIFVTAESDSLAKCVFYGGIITLNKMPFYKLYGQGTLSFNIRMIQGREVPTFLEPNTTILRDFGVVFFPDMNSREGIRKGRQVRVKDRRMGWTLNRTEKPI